MRRREFIGAAAAAAGAVAGRVFAQARTAADTAFVNCTVVTMNPAQPAAEAIAVRGGRIIAVGTRDEIEGHCDAQTEVVDLDGKCVTPGLIDAHSHVIGFGQANLYFVNVRPPKVHSFGTLRRALAQAARDKKPGEWIVARGFVDFDEGRFPRRWEIDESTPRNPVLVIHWSGQFGVANSLALQKANLLRPDVRDPYGGKYLRDRRSGTPDGCLLHYTAIYSVYHPKMNPTEAMEAGQWGVERFAREGVTCVHDNFCHPKYAASYIQLERAGKLPLRVRVYPYQWTLEQCQQTVARVQRYNGPLVRLQGIKLAADGFPLMYKVEPRYAHLNVPMHPPDKFQAMISTIHRGDMQVDVHAVGDRAVDMTMDAFQRAAGSVQAMRERRHRIEHFMFRRQESIRRAADAGVPVCTQPIHIIVRGDDFVQKVGINTAKYMTPMASFRMAGVQISMGADVPAAPSHRPIDNIRCAMLRRTGSGAEFDRSERVSFTEGLEAYTTAAAYAALDEKELGSIEVGKYGDLAVWNMDVRTVRSAADLDRVAVVATYLAGKRTYRA